MVPLKQQTPKWLSGATLLCLLLLLSSCAGETQLVRQTEFVPLKWPRRFSQECPVPSPRTSSGMLNEDLMMEREDALDALADCNKQLKKGREFEEFQEAELNKLNERMKR